MIKLEIFMGVVRRYPSMMVAGTRPNVYYDFLWEQDAHAITHVSFGFLLEQEAHAMTHVSFGLSQSKMTLHTLLLTCL